MSQTFSHSEKGFGNPGVTVKINGQLVNKTFKSKGEAKKFLKRNGYGKAEIQMATFITGGVTDW